jgi:hypothetical protein
MIVEDANEIGYPATVLVSKEQSSVSLTWIEAFPFFADRTAGSVSADSRTGYRRQRSIRAAHVGGQG